jgi:hypothetical protein
MAALTILAAKKRGGRWGDGQLPSQVDRAPASLAGLLENVSENFVRKFRAKDVERSLHLRIHDGFGERRSKHAGLPGLATQRLG